MKFIVNNKIYDTETAEKLCSFSEQWKVDTILGAIYPYRDTDLYRTKKGAYFIVSQGDYGRFEMRCVNEHEAKRYLMYNDYSKYVELFGELEEA